MKFLVTGGAGFIGSHLTEKLLADGHQVCCLDNFNDYYDPQIKRNNIEQALQHSAYTLYEYDILAYEALEEIFKTEKFDLIVHLAARAGVRPSLQQPMLYEKVNLQGTIHLLELCRLYDVQKFVFASSSSVYGANKKVPFEESDLVDNPISPYAATKKSGELICYTYHHLYNMSINCLRFFTVYGPRQRPEMAIHKFAKKIWSNESIPVFGDGKSRRDYTFISDIIQGIQGAINFCDGYNIYNLGESNTVELLYLIQLLENALGKNAKIDFQSMQPGDVPITFADISKAKKEIQYNPQTLIEEGIEQFAKWFRKNNS